MEWYPQYIDNFQADTLRLTPHLEGIYRRMLDWYYKHEMPIPDDDVAIAQIARIGVEDWRVAAPTIRRFFVTHMSRVTGEKVLRQKRCDAVIALQTRRRKDWKDRQEKQRKNGLLEDVTRDTPQDDGKCHAPIGEERIVVEDTQSLSDRPSPTTQTESASDVVAASEKSEPAPRQKRPRIPKSVMPPDWLPSEATTNLLLEKGLTHDELRSEIADTRHYWSIGEGRGTMRPGWDSTLIRRINDRLPGIKARRGNVQLRTPGHNGGSLGTVGVIAQLIREAEAKNPLPGNGGREIHIRGVGDLPRPKRPGPLPGPDVGETIVEADGTHRDAGEAG